MTKRNTVVYEEVSARYLSGETLQRLSVSYGVNISTIANWLDKTGTKRRSMSECHRQYSCNHSFFDSIDTEPKAYWLGFLAADGYISPREPVVSISLAEEDGRHIALFKTVVESTHPIDSKKPSGRSKQQQRRISISSPQMVKALAIHGVVPNKSLIALPAKLSPELMPHYWRGVFDGDGGIFSRRKKGSNPLWRPEWQVCLVGSMPMIDAYSAWVRSICSAAATVRKMTHSPVYFCTVTGRINCAAVLSAMYAGSSVSLERKRRLYEQVLADAAIDRRPRGYYAKLAV